MQRVSRLLACLALAALPLISSAAGFSDCPQFFPSGKPPAIPAQPLQRELCFSEFTVLHSGATKTPIYVAQRLNAQMLKDGRQLKRKDKFYADARLPRARRAGV
jgi:endonuclease G